MTSPEPRQARHPNVIVVFTDQQRWDSTGVHGNPLGLTPNFDRMAQHGTHLARTFTCAPLCAPARASLQTGMYPTTTGCFRNRIPLDTGLKTLAHFFREAGYDTAYIGKWHLADQEPVGEAQRGGYEYWLAANALELVSESYRTVVYDAANQPVSLPGYRVDALMDVVISYVHTHQASHPERPFYLFLSLLEPHHQNHLDDYVAPDGYREQYTGRWVPADLAALGGSAHQHLGGYWGCVKRIDEALGRLLDALKSVALTDQTIVLFTSDHGCHFKTRNAEYKRSCHEASIRVPTAIQGPGFDGGGRLPQLVSSIDLPPTLLQAAGLPIPAQMQGRSLMPLLRRAQPDWANEVLIQISESQVGRAIRTQRWKYSVTAPGRDGRTESAADRYVEEFLYDLAADPHELTNLAGCESHHEVARSLRERLIRCMVEAGEAAPIIEAAPPRPAGQRRVSPDEVFL